MVRVVQQLIARLTPPERHHQGGDNQIGGLTLAHRPANKGVIVEVTDPGQKQLAVGAAELADVRDPTQIGFGGGEVTLQQIRRRDHLVVPAPPLPPSMSAHKAIVTHESGDTMPADPVALSAQLATHPRRTIGVTALSECPQGCSAGSRDRRYA